MRSCIYCGKTLEKDELCQCSGAVARRKQKAGSTSDTSKKSEEKKSYNAGNAYTNHSNSYQTGYTKKENPFKSAWNTYTARKNAARNRSGAKKSHRRNVVFDTLSFMKSPINTIYNPGSMHPGFIITVSALCGALFAFCAYFIVFGILKNAFAFVSTAGAAVNIFASTGLEGIVFAILSGAIVGVLSFLLYSASFYIINRFTLKRNKKFWDFSSRLVLCPLPLAIATVPGLLFAMFSPYVLLLIMVCGIICTVILTYEALRIEWSSVNPNIVLYLTLFGFFITGLFMSSLLTMIL